MTVYFDLSFQNQTINPSVGTYSSGDGVTPSFELVDNEYYLKNVGSHGYYHFNIANIPNDAVIEFDLVFNNKYSFNWIFLFESTNSNWWGIGSNHSDLQLRGYNLSELTLASNITNGTKYHVTLISQYNISGNTIKIYLNNNLVASTTIATTYERSQFLLLGNTGNYMANCYIKDILVTDLSTDTTKYLNGTGLSEVWTNTKNYVSAQLLGKSNVGHTHVASDITNLSENWTVSGENLNISFGTSGSTWVYDANTKHLTIS